jgi:crotonobetainyl-CoA:carnitine CoA-transferase CaiB-like acyl-CoA transferase
MLFTLEHPVEGEIKQLGFPYKLFDTPAKVKLRPPSLGEHNEEVLKGWLNYSNRDIARFKADKVI